MGFLQLPDWLGTYGPAGGMGLALVFGLYREWLVPRRTVNRLEAVWAGRLAEAVKREEQWRRAYFMLAGHTDRLMVVADVVESVMGALPTPDGTGDAHEQQ